MAIFYFSVNIPPVMECEGVELSTMAEARHMALEYAGKMLADQPASFWTSDDFTLTVSDECRLVLFTIAVVGWNAAAGMGLTSFSEQQRAGATGF